MQNLKQIDGIIFDVDGTLWNATDKILDAYNHVIEEDGRCDLVSKEQMESVMGFQIFEIADLFFPNLEKEDRMDLINKCCEHECAYLSEHVADLFPNVKEVLVALSKQYPLYIVSNCQDGYIEVLLETHDMTSYIKDYECNGRNGLAKAQNIQLIIDRNKIKHPIYVGDTIKDLEACKEVDMPFIYASYGFGDLSDDAYEYKIDQFQDLLNMFKKEKPSFQDIKNKIPLQEIKNKLMNIKDNILGKNKNNKEETIENKEEKNNYIHKYKIFFVSDMDEEANYLHEMSKKGYHFKKKYGIRYSFEKGEPMNYYYHLGYYEIGKRDEDRYVDNFKEVGWESIYKEKGEFDGVLHYFRCLEESDEAPSIYSDQESKKNLYVRLLASWRNLITMIVICMVFMAGIFYFLITHPTIYQTIFMSIFGVVLTLLCLTMALYVYIYLKVKRKLNERKYD